MYTSAAAMQAIFNEHDLIQLTNSGGNSVDTTVLNAVVDRAHDFIDTYLSQATVLPLAQSVIDGSPLPGFAADVAFYYLYTRGQGATDSARERYRDAVRWLELYAAGRVSLGAGDAQAPAQNDTIKIAQGQSGFNWGGY